MRGGRGGRFGGRGGTGTSSMAYELIRDNLEDLGIESTHNGHDTDRSPPPLYPRISLPPPISSSSEDLQALYRMREFMKRSVCLSVCLHWCVSDAFFHFAMLLTTV
jgi:hypothetical protein